MGVCCIKGNHHQHDYNQGHRKRDNRDHLMDKSICKNKDSIFTTQTKSDNNNFNNNGESVAIHDVDQNKNNKSANGVDSRNMFFTYFAYTQTVQALVTQYISMKQKGGNPKFDQKLNNIDTTNKENKEKSQENDKQQDQNSIRFMIQEGRIYLDRLKSFMQSSFMAQAQKLEIIKLDKAVSKQTLIKMVSQMYELHFNDFNNQEKEQYEDNQLNRNLNNHRNRNLNNQRNRNLNNHLIRNLKADLFKIFIAKEFHEVWIPGKVNPLNLTIENLLQNTNKYNPEDQLIQRPHLINNGFYLIKLQLSDFLITQATDKNISTISLFLIESGLITKKQHQQQIASINVQDLVSKMNHNTNHISNSFQIQAFITSNTIIKFVTYPLESTFTLHAPEFLKFIHLDQPFSFVTKTVTSATKTVNSATKSLTSANNPKNPKEKQLSPKIQTIATIRLNMQVFSSDWKDSLNKLKLKTKNIVKELQIIGKGQNTWDHLNSLRSSFASISQNQSSFVSNFDSGAFCC